VGDVVGTEAIGMLLHALHMSMSQMRGPAACGVVWS